MKIPLLITTILLPIMVMSQQQPTIQDQDKLFFNESFMTILDDMGNHFQHLRGKQFEVGMKDKQFYEAKLYLYGMRNYTNESDIVVEEGRSRYIADYGPYFNQQDLDNKKRELLTNVKELLDTRWTAHAIDNGFRFISDNSPANSVFVYHYYGDGSGIFIRIMFEVKD